MNRVVIHYCSRDPLHNSLRAQAFRLVRNLGAFLKVYVHPSKKRNNECGPAWKTRRARPEAHICCALPLGKGATLTIETRLNSCTLQAHAEHAKSYSEVPWYAVTGMGNWKRTNNRQPIVAIKN